MKQRLFAVVLLGMLVGWLFAPALSGGSSFCYRDAGHFYHPLFEYIRNEWGTGRIPLWNPYENSGVPLLAENTSSVLYPGKLLFALPLDYTWLYNAYIVLHVVLAAATGYALARHFRAGPPAATLGGLAYAFSGNVLFQYCNVVFLVGAAWLPLAMLLADEALRRRSVSRALALGVVLALVVMGGDPHMAYNIVLLAGLYALLLWRDDVRAARASGEQTGVAPSRWRPVLLGVSLATAGLCAAVQVLPTLEAGPSSGRAKYDSPRNVYELAQTLVTEPDGDESLPWYDGMLGGKTRGHTKKVYFFSVAPWRAIELFWPNVTGGTFSTNRRWLATLQMEFNVWVPSLYLGLAPCVLALSVWSVRRTSPLEIRFFSWMALLGAIGAMGHYGVAWLVGCAIGETDGWGIGGETGGLYWWLNTLLPKYVQFRYPSKLWVPASLGLSMLAACGWRAAWESTQRRVLVLLAAVGLVSVGMIAAMSPLWQLLVEHAQRPESDDWMGPFDWPGAASDARGGLQHAVLLAAALWLVFWIGRSRPRYRKLMQMGVLAVTVLDLAVAQTPLICYAPADDWRFRPEVLSLLPPDRTQYRVYHYAGPVPDSWAQNRSPDRYEEWLILDRKTLSPRHPMPYRILLVESLQTIAGFEYETLLAVARSHNYRLHRVPLPDASVLDMVATRAIVASKHSKPQMHDPQPLADDMFFSLRDSAFPRAWIVHRAEVVPELKSRSVLVSEKFTEKMLFPDGQPRDWRSMAVVETDQPVSLEPPLDSAGDAEHCEVVYADPLRVEIEATLESAGLVILSDLYYPGWELTVETDGGRRQADYLRTNRVMRGTVLPAGTHRLVYRYRPRSFFYGAVISALSWLALSVTAVMGWRRRRRLRLDATSTVA